MMTRMLAGVVAAAAAVIAAPGAYAQATSAEGAAWPSKPIRWVVPFAPGGPTDIVARVVGAKLSERVGHAVIVENRPGAGGNIGMEAVAKAPADGHTILFVIPAVVTNPYFFRSSVDPGDLAPVIQLTKVSLVLLTHPAFPPKTVAEIIAQVKARPGTVSCGSSGALPTVGCELLRAHARADMIMVQYKGNGPALNALVGGEINILFDVVNTAFAQVSAGRVRAIASTNLQRGSRLFPDLPVVAETIPDFDLVSWQGVMAPRATPREVVLRLNREIGAALEQPDVRQRLSDTGLEVAGGPVSAFEELLKRESAKFGKVLREAGIRPE